MAKHMRLTKEETHMLREIAVHGSALRIPDGYLVGSQSFDAATGEALYYKELIDVKPGDRTRRVVSYDGRAFLASLTAVEEEADRASIAAAEEAERNRAWLEAFDEDAPDFLKDWRDQELTRALSEQS